MATPERFDLVIAGGGTVGCSLALALANTGLNIAIVEARPFTSGNIHPGFDARAIALGHGSYQTLTQYGLALENFTTAIRHIHVSDQGHLGQAILDHQQHHLPALGYVVELQDLGAALHNALQDSGVTWFCPDSISDLEQHQEHIKLQLDSGKTLQARLLVIAEGSNSPCLNMLKIATYTQAYSQHAIIANVTTSEGHINHAFERFTENGPLALLPMSGNNRCSLVWTVTPEEAEKLLAVDDDKFLQKLQLAFGLRLGHFSKVGERFSYPLALNQAEQFVHHRVVAIGNAAQSLHPIAGQGFNLGLRDVDDLYQSVKSVQDPGAFSVLQHYKENRLADKQRVIGLTDGLVRFFSNQYSPMVMARNISLLGLDMSGPVKAALAEQAMGRIRGKRRAAV